MLKIGDKLEIVGGKNAKINNRRYLKMQLIKGCNKENTKIYY